MAGLNNVKVVQIFRQVVEQVGLLHESGMLHFGEWCRVGDGDRVCYP